MTASSPTLRSVLFFSSPKQKEKIHMARTRKNTVAPQSIALDWTAIESDLNSGNRVSLSHLAQAHKVFPIDLRKIFEDRYGDRIIFKRGRTGGVYWKAASSSSAAVVNANNTANAVMA